MSVAQFWIFWSLQKGWEKIPSDKLRAVAEKKIRTRNPLGLELGGGDLKNGKKLQGVLVSNKDDFFIKS
jgi:hypothetical protein